jgi:hypothetical protein
MSTNPMYETDDDTIVVGDLVRVPASNSSFVEEAIPGAVIALGSSYTGPCKRVTCGAALDMTDRL